MNDELNSTSVDEEDDYDDQPTASRSGKQHMRILHGAVVSNF